MARYLPCKRAPWQSSCDRCGAALVGLFWWCRSKHATHRVICAACKDVKDMAKALAYEPSVDDPRYA